MMKLHLAFGNVIIVAASLSLMAEIANGVEQSENEGGGGGGDDDDEYDNDQDQDYDRDVRLQHARPKAGKMNACLQNCAYCVQFWEHGLYNGRRCAKRCVHRRGRVVVDPDCNDPKMFNYSPRIISDLLIEMRENQADQPSRSDEEDNQESGQDVDEIGSTRNRAERSGGDEINQLSKQSEGIERRERSRARSGTTSSGKKSYEAHALRSRNKHKNHRFNES